MKAGVPLIFALILGTIALLFFFRSSPEKVEKPDVIAAALKDMKYNPKMEKYRSENSTTHTIAGTIMEQAIDIAVAVLERPEIKKFGDEAIKSKEDAEYIASIIEKVGKNVVKDIKSGTEPKDVIDKAKQYAATEVKNIDEWYPIFTRIVKDNKEKLRFNDRQVSMLDEEPERVKEDIVNEVNRRLTRT